MTKQTLNITYDTGGECVVNNTTPEVTALLLTLNNNGHNNDHYNTFTSQQLKLLKEISLHNWIDVYGDKVPYTQAKQEWEDGCNGQKWEDLINSVYLT